MANRFLNNIRINDEYTLPENDGSAGQAIITDGSGNLSFGSAVASSADSSESIHITVKNTSGATITKGTPVYITGETGNSGKIEVAPADASDSAKMPAVGIIESTLSNNSEGFCVQGGLLEGLVTDTIDGTTTTANDTVYVKSGGGLTMTKPTGSDNLIQNIAKVARTHASNGSLIVSSILRTNDVPNLPEGRIWVGDGNTIVSDTVYVDEPNNRVGIGTTSPAYQLTLGGNAVGTTEGLRINDPSNAAYGAHFSFSDTPNEVWIGGVTNNTYNSAIGIHREATRAITIDVDSNVGIGTTSPAAKLEVKKSSYNAGNAIANFVNGNDPVRVAYDTVVIAQTDVPTLSIVETLDGSQANEQKLTFSVGDNKAVIASTSTATGGMYFNVNRDVDAPGYNTGNGITALKISNNGNVGIGTTDPSSQLSIGSNAITTKKPTVVIADGVAGGSLVIRGLSPILSFDRTGADPQNKILMDNAGLEFKTGTLDAEGDVDFKITGGGDLQLSKGAKISNQENTDIDSAAAEVVAEVSISYTAAFFDFVVKKGTNVRSGTVYACHDGTNVEFTETSTNDLGDTSDVTLSVDISGGNMRLLATVTSDDWSVKSLIRAI